MRRAIVHIGLPRTGTTSVQHVLAALRPQLLQAGILYPDLTPRSETTPHLSHQYLGEALDGRRPRAELTELLDGLSAQLAATPADTVLLSYEGFCRRRPFRRSPAGRFRDLFAAQGFALETLLTVKPQTEYLNSLYTLRTQWLREARPFAEYALRGLYDEGLDYDRLAAPWRAASNDRLHLVPLRDRRSDRPLAERILTQLGLWDRLAQSLARYDLDRRENRSPGPVAVEASRLLCASGYQPPDRGTARQITRAFEDAADAAGLDSASFQGVDADLAARIGAECETSNDRLARRCWNDAWAARMAIGAARPVNQIASMPEDAPARQAVAALLAAVAGRVAA